MSLLPSPQRTPPTLITVDAFDTPPRPNIDKIPFPNHHHPFPSHLPPKPIHTSFPSSSDASSCSASSSRPSRNGPPTPESPSTPSIPHPRSPLAEGVTINQTHNVAPIFVPLRHAAIDTPMTTPTGSGSSTPQMDFDEPPPDHPFEYLGGGGLYNLIGARMFLPAGELKTLVDRAEDGSDLRDDQKEQVSAFGDMFVWNEGPLRKMTRARIRYDGDTRFYHPIIKPPHRKMADLIDTPLQGGQYLHISPPYSSQDVAALQEEIALLKQNDFASAWSPRLVFEPTPPSCHVGQRSWLEQVAPGLHILSPNHEELLSFYGHPKLSLSDPRFVSLLEELMLHLLQNVGIGQNGEGILAVRCGRMGSCIGTKKGGLKWFTAYYTPEQEDLVKDVTGAGNAFIGGYVAGLTLTNEDAYEAALYGTVAASFVVEQIGLPSVQILDGVELWNGQDPTERVTSLRDRWVAAGLL